VRLGEHRIKRHGRVLDKPEQRVPLYAEPVVHLKKLPPKVVLRPQCPQVIYDQGQLGGCTGNAITCAIQFDRLTQKRKTDCIPSRLLICYNERDMESTVTSDSGAQIRDGVKSASELK
jgi:hypothetical protein